MITEMRIMTCTKGLLNLILGLFHEDLIGKYNNNNFGG